MKTVLLVLDNFEIGGVLTVINMYSDVLLNQGYKVILIGKEGNASSEKLPLHCKRYQVSGQIRDSLLGRMKDCVGYVLCLSKVYRENDIDIIHFSQTWSSLYALINYHTWQIKRVVTFHGVYYLENRDYFEPNFLTNYINTLRRLAQKFVLFTSEAIIVLSSYSRHLLLTHFSDKLAGRITVIPGFVSIKPTAKTDE